ncbi:zgc:103586 isoform X5 [Dicentrarchus labrax]|uniref:zgc:103586 isoform X5 n=1 Tax=Dicentrarchus labrax TaxID=13489 RepID=UPI0021F5C56B|nr:zgc:103586 isoform X5 [Dicentrarchus labrax]
MAAPPTDRPVILTLAALWRSQLRPLPPRPPRLSVAATVVQTALTLAQVIFGVVYFNDCPQQPNIPNYLLGMALLTLLMIPCVTLPCESDAAQPRGHPKGFKACLMCLLSLCIFIWILAGDVWVFSVYQPNYDRSAADGLYCDKTLYTFALWNATWGTFFIMVQLVKVCYVLMSPTPANRDFYGNV